MSAAPQGSLAVAGGSRPASRPPAGTAAGVARRRRVSRAAAPATETPFGSLRSDADHGRRRRRRRRCTSRSTSSPTGPARRRRRRPTPALTVVFVHGYALNLDCWHFQRAAYRGLVRAVFYDQRSHGRSGRSTPTATPRSTSSASDLLQVLDAVVPRRAGRAGRPLDGRHDDRRARRAAPRAVRRPGRRRRPDLDHRRRARTCSRILLPSCPSSVGGAVAQRLVADARPRAPRRRRAAPARPVRRHGRHRRSSRSATTCPRQLRRVRRRDALGDAVRGGRGVLPELRARSTSSRPSRRSRPGPDRRHLRHRGQAHLDRPQPQAARAHRRLDAARVRRRRPHGDPGAARPGQRRARPAAGRGRGSGSTAGERRRHAASGPEAAADRARRGLRAAFEAAAAARPAGRRARRDRGVDRRARSAARRAARRPRRASRSARWCSTRSASTMYLRRFGVAARGAQGHGVAAALIEAAVEARRGLRRPDRRGPRRAAARPCGSGSGSGFREIRRDAAERRAAPAAAHAPLRRARRRRDARARAARWPASSGRATWSCSAASSAPARRRSPRASAPGSASAATSPRRRS